MRIDPVIRDDIKKYLKQRLRDEKEKIVITASHRLTAEERGMIMSRFPDFKHAQISYLVDDELLAGIVIRRGSRIIDLSLHGIIRNFKKILI